VLRIAAGLPNMGLPLLAWFGMPVPLFVRDLLYDQVANNRYSILGKRDVCRLSDESFRERFIAE
jgi:predicted DCC family thiol-disulfide oxidoreductase YuxK